MALAVATDLKSMIELISSRNLVRDIVESHIPKPGIDWKKSTKKNLSELLKFTKNYANSSFPEKTT